MKIGIVLEGGGMRGIYTVGVLDFFMDNNIFADYVIGVSAGACNAASYLSKQRGRSLKINTEYIKDKRYISLSNFIKTKSVFGMDFLFDEIPHKLDKFDYETLLNSKIEFKVGVTDVITGKPVYFGKEDFQYDCTVLRASSSIPVFSPIVKYKEGLYLDGGTSDPIPVMQAFKDGCDKVIVVLTRNRDYVKKPEGIKFIYKKIFEKYPNMSKVLDNRADIYNNTLKKLRILEKEGKALIIAPSEPIKISRFEKNVENLKNLYNIGIKDASKLFNKIENFMV